MTKPEHKRRRRDSKLSSLVLHLAELKSRGVIKEDDKQEILRQYHVFRARRNELVGHDWETVIVSNGELFFGRDYGEARKKALEKHGERKVYSETVNLVEYPSPIG